MRWRPRRPASPLRLAVSCDDDALRLCVQDRGPGFSAAIWQRLGQPYQSSKGNPGRGLGLFLAVNVARTLGGRSQAHNPPEGGRRGADHLAAGRPRAGRTSEAMEAERVLLIVEDDAAFARTLQPLVRAARLRACCARRAWRR